MPIHPTAIVEPTAIVDPSAEIGPYSIIAGQARIGAGTHIGPHAHILGRATIAENCRIHTGAVIGDLPQDRAYTGADTRCEIGPETIVREYATIHRGTHADTVTSVGARCFLMAHSHVGHNCQLADDVTLVNGALLGGYVSIGPRAIISGNAAIHQFVRVGELALVAGLSKIVQDVPPYMMVDGAGLCVGVNLVGLQRNGFSPEERREIQAMQRRLYRVATSFRAAVDELESTTQTPAGQRLLQFLKTPSKRGVGMHATNRPSPN